MYEYIFCDLDGTLLDDRKRNYVCYCDIVEKFGGKPVSEERYWELKRAKEKRTRLLEETHFEDSYEEYMQEWLVRIEALPYLALEQLKPGAKELLDELRKHTHVLSLITLRQNRENLLEQLEALGIYGCFDMVYSTSPLGEKTKADLLTDCVEQMKGSKKILVLGDSEADEQLAKDIGAEFCAITDGVREQRFLKADVYCSNVQEAVAFLGKDKE